MANSEDLTNRLNRIPKRELIILLKDIYKSDKNQFILDLESILNIKTKDPFQKISLLNSSMVIELIKNKSSSAGVMKSIEELYFEWWQSKSPSLFFSEIKKEKDDSFYKLDLNSQKDTINKLFLEINNKFNEKSSPEFKNLQIVNYKIIDGVIEIEIEYERKLEYINPLNKSPSYIYTLLEGIIWISSIQKTIIAKVNDYAFLSILLEGLRKILKCDIVRFNLSKELVNTIFGFESLKKASYVELNPENEEYLEKKDVSDKNFSNKTEGKLLDNRCERPSSINSVKFFQSQNTIGIHEKGNIRIYRDICKTELKRWAMNLNKNIIESTSKFEKEDFKTYLKIFNFDDIPLLDSFKIKAKEILREIMVSFFKVKNEFKTEHKINYTIGDIYNNLNEYFDFVFYPVCSDCGNTSYLCNSCKSMNSVIISGPGLNFKCEKCGKRINEIEKDIICPNDPAHSFSGSPFTNVFAVGNNKLMNIINNISDFMDSTQKFETNDSIIVKSNLLKYKKSNYKYEYLFDEITSFSKISKLKDIPETNVRIQMKNLKIISEKCDSSKNSEFCRNCVLEQKGLCIGRLVAEFVEEPKLGPHQGHEFGDLTFKETIDGNLETPICLIKSSIGRANLTLSNDGGLTTQLMKCLIDSRVNFIIIISTANIEGQLKEMIINLTKHYNKKILFIEKENIARLMYDYLNLKKNETLDNKKNWF
jgi:hypothetical protein